MRSLFSYYCVAKMCWSVNLTYCICILLFVTKLHVRADISEDLVVETKLGSIRGLRADDGNYTMFMGIPFAKVDESNIFGESIPQEPFDEVFEAYNDSERCPQVEEFNLTAVGSLDCLHLNVYVPDSASTQNRLPVMVYIYGGGFEIGFADRFILGPKYLVRQDIILVTFNYRLGPYGFMCLNTPEVPGNAGFKDQVMALRWIKNHIESFGGDPYQVTVFGNSAGGMSIGLHLVSENEKLFANAIFQSGSVFTNGIVSVRDHGNAVLQLAKELNFTTNDVNEALSFLSSADVQRVVQIAFEHGISFAPCIEKQFPGVERFLAEHPITSNHLKADGIAIMVGFNSDEMLVAFNGNEGPENWNWWGRVFADTLNNNFNFNDTLHRELSDMFRRFYLGDAEINNDVRQQVMDFVNDSTFVYSTIRSIEPYLKAGAMKIYQYRFSYDGGRNFGKTVNEVTVPGVAHADEIGYLFDMGLFQKEPSEEDQLIVDRITTMWANFAKYRNPTPKTTPLLPVTWKPIVNESAYHYIDINTEMTAKTRYEHQRMTFWELFYKAYGQYERADFVADSAASAYFNPIILFVVLTVNVFGKLSN